MKSVAIIYHSGYGHTAKQAQTVLDGAKSVNGIDAHLISVTDVEQHWEYLNSANAIIFGSPVYMGKHFCRI